MRKRGEEEKEGSLEKVPELREWGIIECSGNNRFMLLLFFSFRYCIIFRVQNYSMISTKKQNHSVDLLAFSLWNFFFFVMKEKILNI